MSNDDPFLEACRRMWTAAYQLDALRGDYAATEWLAVHVWDLMRSGDVENVTKILALATALERHLPSPVPEAVAL